jgi:hypothetical protein
LLIFAGRAAIEILDFNFAEAVTPAVEAHGAAWRGIFDPIYIVDSQEGALVQLIRR